MRRNSAAPPPVRRTKGLGAALLAGAALAAGLPPFDMPYGVFLALPVLYLLTLHATPMHGFRIGWVAGVGYFGVALHWIVEPFLVDVARHGWMAPFALILIAGGMALFWGGAFALSRIGRPRGMAAALIFAAMLALAEYLRAHVLTGFPWANPAYIWEETPILQLAAFTGPFGLGLLTYLIAILPVWRGLPDLWGGLAAAAAALGVTVFALDRVPHGADFTGTVLRVIQPNAAQHLKWQPEMMPVFFERQLDQTRGADGIDLVIWPEVSVPYLIEDRPDLNAVIAEAAGPDTRVIVGARHVEDTDVGRRWFNSLAALDRAGMVAARYDKHHLVPFGEYLPFPDLWDRIGLKALAQNAGRFAAGPAPRRISLEDVPPFQPLICYEAIFPGLILTGEDRPDWLLQITNDAWFGRFSGPFQHLGQARFRAVEQGLPLVRSANTGVSAVIDPYGIVVADLPLNEEGVLDAALPAPLPPTFYARYGDRPFLGALLLLVIGSVALRRRATAY